MKIIILSFVILLLPLQDTSAQNRIFRKYRSYCSKSFGIELNKLEEFKVIKRAPLSLGEMPIFKVSEKHNIASFYQMTLESKTKDCLILYPHFDTLPSHKLAAKNMPYGEVAAALNLYENRKGVGLLVNDKFVISNKLNYEEYVKGMAKLDSAKYVSVIAQDDMTDYFNADTVFIFKVRLPKPYMGIYSECIGINAIKEGYPSAMMKILLTEAGKKKEEEYMQLLFDNIHYPDVVSKHNQEK